MQIIQVIKQVFAQLHETLHQLSPDQYTAPSKSLFNASIGQHVRHIVELFQCLEHGYTSGKVNYELRKRDRQLETNKDLAIAELERIARELHRADRQMDLEMNCGEHPTDSFVVSSNYYREVVFNLEHTIHHMALIRVGVSELSDINLPTGFGVASSTIKHNNQVCAQ
jgi:uncharacterized damage-inducible protein DinB